MGCAREKEEEESNCRKDKSAVLSPFADRHLHYRPTLAERNYFWSNRNTTSARLRSKVHDSRTTRGTLSLNGESQR